MGSKNTLRYYDKMIKSKVHKRRQAFNKYKNFVVKEPRILFIDGNNLFMRAFSSGINKFNESSKHIGGVQGFLTSLRACMSFYKPEDTYIFFDGKNNNQRKRELYPEYKQGRNMRSWNVKDTDIKLDKNAFFEELNKLLEYLYTLPVKVVKTEGYEADDGIAYVIQERYENKKSVIMSTDKDFLQLANKNVTVWNSHKHLEFGEKLIKETYDIVPQNIIYWRILDGDKSDLEDFFEKIKQSDAKDIDKDKVLNNKEQIEINFKIMSLDKENILLSTKDKVKLLKSIDNFWGDNNFYIMDFKRLAVEDGLNENLVGNIIADFEKETILVK